MILLRNPFKFIKQWNWTVSIVKYDQNWVKNPSNNKKLVLDQNG